MPPAAYFRDSSHVTCITYALSDLWPHLSVYLTARAHTTQQNKRPLGYRRWRMRTPFGGLGNPENFINATRTCCSSNSFPFPPNKRTHTRWHISRRHPTYSQDRILALVLIIKTFARGTWDHVRISGVSRDIEEDLFFTVNVIIWKKFWFLYLKINFMQSPAPAADCPGGGPSFPYY